MDSHPFLHRARAFRAEVHIRARYNAAVVVKIARTNISSIHFYCEQLEAHDVLSLNGASVCTSLLSPINL